VRKGERNKQPTGLGSSHAKRTRTKDDDEEDPETTLIKYGVQESQSGRIVNFLGIAALFAFRPSTSSSFAAA
jgi:hypothetical protein